MDGITAEANMSGEKAQSAMIEAARLAGELRPEQESTIDGPGEGQDISLSAGQGCQNRVDEAEHNTRRRQEGRG